MKLYLAGNGKSKGSAGRDYDAGARNRLLSYAFEKDWAKEEFEYWIDNGPPHADVFLDSGAFSAFTLGRKIDLDQYCQYLHAHAHALSAYFVLDVIGDESGTRRNLETMRSRGLAPLPIYHVGFAPLPVLDGILQDVGPTRYMALGGMASERLTRQALQEKLDACWRRIEPHWPVRVHGLGVLAQWALERYPWYSVDGSSAIVAAGMGRVNRFADGQMTSSGWREDVQRTYDGIVADGIGRVRSKEGGSESAHEGRRIRNIQAQLAMERYITDLWTARGVVWPAVQEGT